MQFKHAGQCTWCEVNIVKEGVQVDDTQILCVFNKDGDERLQILLSYKRGLKIGLVPPGT